MTGFGPGRNQPPKFPSGEMVVTSTAMDSLVPEDVRTALNRHFRGDWGECDAHDWQENDYSLQHRGRLLSVFQDLAGTKFRIITDAQWETTTVLLPDDY